MHSKVILKRYGSVKLVLLFRTVTSLRGAKGEPLAGEADWGGATAYEMLTMLILVPLVVSVTLSVVCLNVRKSRVGSRSLRPRRGFTTCFVMLITS